MTYRSNAAEAWYPDSQSAALELSLDLLPPPSLTRPLWRSLVGNLRDTLAPEKLPPLQLTSRPVKVGLLLGDRLFDRDGAPGVAADPCDLNPHAPGRIRNHHEGRVIG